MQGDVVEAALSSIRAAVDEVNGVALWSRSHGAALDDTRACFGVLQQVHALYLAMVADVEGRALPEGVTARAFLREGLHRTSAQAAGDLRAALSRLPRSGEAFAAGEISREYLDVMVKTVERIPEELRHREVSQLAEFDAGDGEPMQVIDAVDALLSHHARRCDSHALQQIAKALLAALDPDADDGFDPLAFERRSEVHARDENGMVVGRFTLDAANGADLVRAIDHLSAPNPRRTETADDGTTVEIVDARTPAQRRADALGIMARLAMGAAEAGTRGGEPARVVLYTGIDDYHDVHCPDPAHTAPSAAPAPSTPAPSTPAPSTPAPSAPGSSTPGSPAAGEVAAGEVAADAHHVTFWRHGGRTDLDELVLVCGQHHSAVHLGLIEIRMIDGLPWVRPPRHVDPQRRWIRNTYHHDMDQARDLGARLRPPPTREERGSPEADAA